MNVTWLKLALAASIGAAIAQPARAEPVTITILGVGDIYDFEGGDVRGGFARLNAVAKAEKAANPNTLYVLDGDMFSPSILSGLDKGQNTVDLTNVVPFDLAVPGNHEFDFGPDNFFEKVGASKYPWAAINMGPDNRVADALHGVTFKEVGGIRIALVPVAYDATPEVSSSGDLAFAPSVATAIAAGRQARADGADLVVCIAHTDLEQDRALVASGVFDVVVSGHDHIYATSYNGVTAYLETSTEADFLAPLDLAVTVTEKDGKRRVTWTPTFRFIDTASVTPDPATQQIVDGLKAKLDTELADQIGATEVELDSRRAEVRTRETSMGDLIADAIRAATGADIAITNGGGIRGDTIYPAGATLTRGDILAELPFGNITVMTELPGSQILLALEHGVSQVENAAGRFPQVSGISFAFDPAAPAGSRVSEVMVGGAPLEEGRLYKTATNNYMLNGGDGYAALGGGRIIIGENGGNLMANDVIAYVEKSAPVDPVMGRITQLGVQ